MLIGHSAPGRETPSQLDLLTCYSSEGGQLVGHLAPRICTPFTYKLK